MTIRTTSITAAVLFLTLALLTLGTGPSTEDPTGPWPAQHVIYPDYPAPVSTLSESPEEILAGLDPSAREGALDSFEIGRGDSYEEAVREASPDSYWRLGDQNRSMVSTVGGDVGLHSPGVDSGSEKGTQNVFSSYDSPDDYSTAHGLEGSARTLSVELWLRNDSTDRRSIPLSKGVGQALGDSAWWFEWRADNKLAFALWTGQGRFSQVLSANPYDDYWHHVLGTYDGSSIRLYVDGALVGRVRQTGVITQTAAPVTLGNVASRPAATAFRGDLDELAIYDRVVPPKLAEEHYLQAASTLRSFSADTIYWELLPSSWQERATWQLSFPEGASTTHVFAEGDEVAPTSENLTSSYLDTELPDLARAYEVPNELVDRQTKITVVGRGSPPAPEMTFFMGRDFGSAASTEHTPDPWWQRNFIVSLMLSVGLYILLAAMMVWAVRQIKALGLSRRQWRALLAVVVLETCLAVFSTNLDLQIFKGVAERYWILEPIRGLTLSGYGPVMDALFVLPMLPYLLVAELTGSSSEFALNLAMRLPMLIGTYFMIGATARLTRVLQVSPTITRWIFYGLVLNPVVILWALWHPESLVVGMLVLTLSLILEDRFLAGGLMYGLSVTSKYWPLFAGPLILAYLWRAKSTKAAGQWLVAGVGTTIMLSGIYWAPTFLSLSSLDELSRLLYQRLPYFGGSEASSYSTIWSLYGIPRELLGSRGWHDFVTGIESASFFIVVAFLVLITALYIAGEATFRRLLVAVAAILVVVAGVNSLSVVGFALWSLPFLLLASTELRRRRLILAVGFGAWCSGVLVAFVVEPISYWLLHANASMSKFALDAALWLNDNLVSPELARAFGFIFCLLMTMVGGMLIVELGAGGRLGAVRESVGVWLARRASSVGRVRLRRAGGHSGREG